MLAFDDNEGLEAARARNILDALREDMGLRDHTAQLVPDLPVTAQLVVREPAVLCGCDWFEGCLLALDADAQVHWAFEEGDDMPADAVVCRIQAKARALLTAERPALNFLQTLSATATTTRAHVAAIRGASPNPQGCQVLDTRKTLPGLRQAQKYAVRVGGGHNQRMALWAGILIKENHIAAAGGIAQALAAARGLDAGVPIQVEVENLAECETALMAGAEQVLIDNFSLEDMRAAVALAAEVAQRTGRPRAQLEASGGLDLSGLRAVAATGVDRISVGRLTKDIKAVDYSLRVL